MTLTKDMIDKLRFAGRIEIDETLEARLVERFREEPYPETYSEQDLHEQVRKYVNYYNEGKKTVSMIF